jgi:CRISPR-associated protein Cst1
MKYQQLEQRRRPATAAADRVELTGNIFVDNGLAVIAALCKCDKIEDLKLRRMKLLHGNGMVLARNNIRLKANHMVFMNSITTQPSYSQKEKIAKYAKMTRAILDNIGHETMPEFCDFCGNPYSIDLTELFQKNIKTTKKNKKQKNKKQKNKKHFVGRDWFPLAGSMLNDAQGLPCASRALNSCGRCLFAVQYLPQGSILVNGLLALFQSTSIPFWYQWVKNLTSRVGDKLALAKRADKVETLGKEEGNKEVANRLFTVMQNSRSKRYDPNTSMIMYQYSNGKGADLKKQRIPSFALNFLHAAAIDGLDQDIKELTYLEGKKTSYKYSFLNCIAEQQDYYLLYPSRSKGLDGASPALFLLYQTYILKHSNRSLHTAYKIAEYLKSKVDTEKLAVNIQRETKKQNTVKKWIIIMASEGVITFDEYYDLFVRSPLDRRNPWMLIKYYISTDKTTEFKSIVEESVCYYNQEYKDRVIKVGTMIFDAYLADKGRTRLVKLLGKFARGDIHRNWLRTQFERLADNNEDFDYSENWNALCINKQGEEDVYQLLYLFRLLWNELSGHS